MSVTRAIAHNTAIQIVGKAISTVLGFVAVVIMTRSLGPEQFGWYTTVTGFLQFIGIFSDFGFTVITAAMLAEPYYDQSKLLNNLFTWRFITALVFHGLAPFLIVLFPYPAPIKIATAITAVSFFAIAVNQVFIGYYQARLRTITQVTGEIIGRLVLVVGLLLAAVGNYGFLPMMIIITFASVIYTGYLWFKCQPIRFNIDRVISKAIFHKLWPTATTVICNAFYLQGDRVILPLYVSQVEVGFYGAAYRIIDIIAQLTFMTMGIVMPLITYAWTRGLGDDFKRRFQTGFDLINLIAMPLMAGCIVLGEPIMRLVAGEKFIGSGRILQYLAIAIAGIAFGSIFGHGALAINRQRQAIAVYATNAILAIVGYFVFIPRYGMYGAAGVAIFAELYAGLGLLLLVRRYSSFQPRLLRFAKIVLASLGMGLVVYIVRDMSLVISIPIGMITYGLTVLALRVVPLQTIREILNRPSTTLPLQ